MGQNVLKFGISNLAFLDQLVEHLVGALVDFQELLGVLALTGNAQLQVDVLFQPHNLLPDVTFSRAQGYLLSLGRLQHRPYLVLQLQNFVLHGIVLGLLQADALHLQAPMDPAAVDHFTHSMLELVELLLDEIFLPALLEQILMDEFQLYILLDYAFVQLYILLNFLPQFLAGFLQLVLHFGDLFLQVPVPLHQLLHLQVVLGSKLFLLPLQSLDARPAVLVLLLQTQDLLSELVDDSLVIGALDDNVLGYGDENVEIGFLEQGHLLLEGFDFHLQVRLLFGLWVDRLQVLGASEFLHFCRITIKQYSPSTPDMQQNIEQYNQYLTQILLNLCWY